MDGAKRQIKRYGFMARNVFSDSDDPYGSVLKDVNRLIEERGAYVTVDGQILSVKLGRHNLIDGYFGDPPAVAVYPLRPWGPAQESYFGRPPPYQPGEDEGQYGYNSVVVDVAEPYLVQGEAILALVHAERDGRFFYCPCHSAAVVYTSKQRLVCMDCGALHCVLQEPLKRTFGTSLSASEWFEYFDDDGEGFDEEVSLDIVDFQDVEGAQKLWATDQWEEASREVTFFARATPEEFERYRGSIVTPDVLLDVGFEHVPTPPPPADQIRGSALEWDLLSNAASSLESGVEAYLDGRADVSRLKQAVLQLFHVVELILKAKLDDLSPGVLAKKPDNPTVLRLLVEAGVQFPTDEIETIKALRSLRNSLQHGEASANYRSTLALLRKTLAFVDRFALKELGLWIGDAVERKLFRRLLKIPSVRGTAEEVGARWPFELPESLTDEVAEGEVAQGHRD